MSAIRCWIRDHAAYVGILTIFIGVMLVLGLPHAGGLWPSCFREGLLAAMVLLVIGVGAGVKEVLPSTRGLGFALRKGIWMLVVALPLPLALLTLNYITGEPIFSDWPQRLLGVTILSILIGLFEEGMFRGIILNSLLSRMGNSYTGLLRAVLISSFLFGFLHIAPSLVDGTVNGVLTLAQALLKTITASMIGMFFAVVYLRNHNLWSIAILHGLNDILVLLVQYLFLGSINTEYVASGFTEGMALMVGYLLLMACYIPLIVVSIRQLRKVDVPQLGFFVDNWEPRKVD